MFYFCVNPLSCVHRLQKDLANSYHVDLLEVCREQLLVLDKLIICS